MTQLTLSTMALETGNTLLSPIDQDLLLSWVALVLMTLQETGVPVEPGAPPSPPRTTTEEGFHMSEGMRGFVRHIIQQYCEQGLTFARLQTTQSIANVEGDSPSVRAMQQNTRLVVITLEVLRDNHVATAMPIMFREDGAAEEGEENEGSGTQRNQASTNQSPEAAGGAPGNGPSSDAAGEVVNGYKEAMSMDGVISSMDYVYCFVTESKQVHRKPALLVAVSSCPLFLPFVSYLFHQPRIRGTTTSSACEAAQSACSYASWAPHSKASMLSQHSSSSPLMPTAAAGAPRTCFSNSAPTNLCKPAAWRRWPLPAYPSPNPSLESSLPGG